MKMELLAMRKNVQMYREIECMYVHYLF